ncbi:ATP-binding protein [Polyangium sp. y55x31]|uniref:ATP-binding protein n=1 Tax=Polyangium sp. y55x31 TaxID=3042688 RepID=UPI002482979C|nr:ATP-binding protein [Polyangium sp. y55x31]MDI1480818.1 ATP-binding protein [Polyangium sp. y55x31]
MKTRFVNEREANDLCSRAEDHFFDRKASAVKPAKIQKAAVAFANADGGELAIGIADDGDQPDVALRWEGPDVVEYFNEHIQALTAIQPALPYEATILRCQTRRGCVLKIDIEKSQSVHHTSDQIVYERKGAQSLPVKDPQRIAEIGFAKGAHSFEDYSVETALTEDVVDSAAISRFLRDFSSTTDPLSFAVNRSLVDRKSYRPKVCGVLLFSDDPSSVMPRKCGVKICRYQTNEDDPEREHLKDVVSVEGPLYDLIHRTVAGISSIMSQTKIWTASGALESVTYPPETLWEIVTNAIVHRDYSISDDVHIHIYDNRIEVTSPGRLPGYVTVDNILDVRYARNPRILWVLSRYKDPPNKDIGEGLNTAFQKMKEWRLQSPVVRAEGNYVKVTIPHAPLATPAEAMLEFLTTNGTITNRQARDLTGIKSENAIRSELNKLRDAGLIELVPELKGSKAAWRRVPG